MADLLHFQSRVSARVPRRQSGGLGGAVENKYVLRPRVRFSRLARGRRADIQRADSAKRNYSLISCLYLI